MTVCEPEARREADADVRPEILDERRGRSVSRILCEYRRFGAIRQQGDMRAP